MSVSIAIRHVPEELRDELASRAAREGISLSEYLLRQLRAIAAGPPLDEVIQQARHRAHRGGARLSGDDILSARDADRR